MNEKDDLPQIKQRPGARWRRVLLMLELCGATVVLWHGVPIYRELLAGNFNRAEPLVRLWVTVATALIQIGYWLRYLHQASPSLPRRVLIGHVLMFLARLNLIFTGGVFSAVFFVRFDQVKFSVSGTGLLLVILFSMFCVTLDLERIGAGFLKGEGSPCNDLNIRTNSPTL
jgi:hypothetical protein